MRLATIWPRRSGSTSTASASPLEMFNAMPSSCACGANASAASRTTSVASHGRGFNENWWLSSRERSRQVAHEALEPAAFRTDDRRRALALVGIGVVEGAVGQRLGVAADRRERSAQVVGDREQERALAAAGLVELRRHLVERALERRELVVSRRRDTAPGRQVAGRELPRRAFVVLIGRVRRLASQIDRSATAMSTIRPASSMSGSASCRTVKSTRSVATTTSTFPRTRVAVGMARKTVLPRRPLTSWLASSADRLDVGGAQRRR